MKLSRFGPKTRTVLITAIVLMLALTISSVAFGRELRVTTEADLRACPSGGVLAAGPDAGLAAAAGDTCVVMPGTYTLTNDVLITLANLTLRSSNGATATIINVNGHQIIIQRDGVTIGGPKADQGFTIFGNVTGGTRALIDIGTGAPAGQADENITIQNNIIRNNAPAGGGEGIGVYTAGAVESFNISYNTIRDINGPGIYFDFVVTSVGRRGPDRNMVISNNYFEANTAANIAFLNTGSIEQLAILDNEIYRSLAASGILFNNVGEVRDSIISGNLIQYNAGFGILFRPTGRVDSVVIQGNKGTTPEQGITRNHLGGIAFLGPCTDLRDVVIDDNTINSNEDLVPIPPVPGYGVFVNVTQDVEGLTFTNNNVRQNGFDGFLKAAGGDFTRSTVSGNVFRNNGLAAGGGFIIAQNANFEENDFSGNEFRENSRQGFSVNTATGDISRSTFTNEQYIKNRLMGMALSTGSGDITDITATGLQANENEGIGFAVPGSGAEWTTITGDLEGLSVTDSAFDNNGGRGLRIESIAVPPNRGDIGDVTIGNSEFNFNGTRAPRGLGSGLAFGAETVRTVSLSGVTADNNNDHGVSFTSSRDLAELTIEDSETSNNDRNFDTVGNGIDLSAAESLNSAVIRNSKASSNNSGIRVAAQNRFGRDITIESNPEINNNHDAGIDLFGGQDLDNVSVTGNSLSGNAIGVRIDVHNRGSDINIAGNRITGADGYGVGVLLSSTGVTIQENAIRKNATGIEVHKLRDNSIHQNNIARNENFGIDATALNPGDQIDATSNWWGEPSGPKHATNPNGIGDRVTDKVNFVPFLGEPVCTTDLICPNFMFTIDAFNVPATAQVDQEVEFTATITNNGTEEGTREIDLTITNTVDGSVVVQKSVTKTINPSASTDVSFKQTFNRAGVYEVKITTQDDSKSATITVSGGQMPWVCDYAGADKIVDGTDLIKGIQDYAGGLLDGSQLITLIQYYATDTPCDQPLPGGSAAAALMVPFSMESVGFSGTQFVVEGVGIAAIDVQVYDLAGRVVFSGSAAGNTLAFSGLSSDGRPLANGIYLYAVTAYGLNGQTARSVEKFAWLR